MNKDLNKLLARAGHALLAAGALGLPVAVVAQQATTYVSVLNGQSQSGSESLLPVTYVEQSAAPVDVKVELAFLANPSLFPYCIEARILGTGLELHGNVPEEASRALAVHVAQEVSGMRVVDALAVKTRPVSTPNVQTPETLQRQAMHVLGQTLGKNGSNVQVDVWNNGQVLLKGSVANYQDKLAASRCLQKVAGCSCVINQLEVPDQEIKTQANVADKANENQIMQVAFVQQPSSEPAAPKTTDATPAKSQPFFTPKWRRWEEVQSKPAQTNTTIAPATTVAIPGPAQVDPKPRTGLWNYFTSNKAQAKPETQQASPVKSEVRVVQASAQQGVIVPEVKASEPAKSGTPGLMLIDSTNVTLLTPTPIQQRATEPAKPVIANQPQTVAKPVAVKSSEAYVTSGVMIFEGNTTEAQPKAAPTSAQNKLQQEIARVCSKPAQDVEVKKLSEKSLLIRVKATDESEGPKLSDLIFRIPELAPYEVSLDIPVVR